MTHRLFIDSDIILDVFAKREPHYHHSALTLSLAEAQKVQAFTSPLVFANIYYVLRKLRSKNYALKSLRKLRIVIDVLPIEDKHVDEALNSSFTDFEDAIQHYVAMSGQVDYIITRNKSDYKSSKIPVCTPHEYLSMLSG